MAFNFKNVFASFQQTASTQPKKVVGIDFGSSSVKVVEIERRDEVLALTTYGELQLGPYGKKELGSTVDLDSPKRTEALVDVIRESTVKAKDGVLALPLASSFVTVMSLTAKPKEDISPRVRVEARKYIPVPVADVTLDWTELASIKGTPETVREVLVAAIQNDALNEMKKLMGSVNMISQPSEIELFSTMRAITQQADQSLGIIDLGAETSKLYISDEGSLRKIHRVRAGGVMATRRIAEMLKLEFEDAENRKRNYSTESEHAVDIKKAMVSSFERPLEEFKRVIVQHELRTGKPLTRVVLSGGSAAFRDIQALAGYILDRDVVRANPFSKVSYPAFMEDVLVDIAPVFSVALGAALRPYESE